MHEWGCAVIVVICTVNMYLQIIIKLITMTHTFNGKSQLSANNSSISIIPKVITDSSPNIAVAYFHTTFR